MKFLNEDHYGARRPKILGPLVTERRIFRETLKLHPFLCAVERFTIIETRKFRHLNLRHQMILASSLEQVSRLSSKPSDPVFNRFLIRAVSLLCHKCCNRMPGCHNLNHLYLPSCTRSKRSGDEGWICVTRSMDILLEWVRYLTSKYSLWYMPWSHGALLLMVR